jgi:hypothetical protein
VSDLRTAHTAIGMPTSAPLDTSTNFRSDAQSHSGPKIHNDRAPRYAQDVIQRRVMPPGRLCSPQFQILRVRRNPRKGRSLEVRGPPIEDDERVKLIALLQVFSCPIPEAFQG